MKTRKANVAVVLGKTAFVTDPEMDFMRLFHDIASTHAQWVKAGRPVSCPAARLVSCPPARPSLRLLTTNND